MITSPAFANRKYAVLGLARSGLGAVRALSESGAQILAWDSRDEARDAICDIAQIGDPLEWDLSGYDGIVVSPGVPLNNHPITAKALEQNVPIIGDIELFALARDSLPPHRVVGITGTNGKSTTTALVHHILKSAAIPVRMGGNIGLPILTQEPLQAGGVYVLELSSYQIDLTHSLACDVAALINLSPDHLDRYDGYAGYVSSKARLFEMQRSNQYSIFGNSDEDTMQIFNDVRRGKDEKYAILTNPDSVAGQEEWPSLQGPHNLQNAAIAIAIVEALSVREPQWRAALRSFKGLAHRMEIVGQRNGVLFVNDSKATNAASVAPALAAYNRIHWILGGVAKSHDLSECAPNFGNVVKAYTIGEAGPRFAEILQSQIDVESCELMVTAVQHAATNAKSGDVVMLSPACSSFDQFKDFEARGDCFKAAALSWIERAV
jgi:UDP-N-acetylmuramoylalanine--D-glutamate ligase